jgi:hypothetical protein
VIGCPQRAHRRRAGRASIGADSAHPARRGGPKPHDARVPSRCCERRTISSRTVSNCPSSARTVATEPSGSAILANAPNTPSPLKHSKAQRYPGPRKPSTSTVPPSPAGHRLAQCEPSVNNSRQKGPIRGSCLQIPTGSRARPLGDRGFVRCCQIQVRRSLLVALVHPPCLMESQRRGPGVAHSSGASALPYVTSSARGRPCRSGSARCSASRRTGS